MVRHFRTSASIPRAEPHLAPYEETDHALNVAICLGAVLGTVTLRALFLVALALAGCSVGIDQRHADPSWPCPYSEEDLHVAAAQVEREMADRMHIPAAHLLDDVRVQCQATGFLRVLPDGGFVTGETFGPRLVRIATHTLAGDELPLRRTSLYHEYVHAIGFQIGDPDPLHETLPFDAIDYALRTEDFVREYGCGGP